MKRAQGWIRQWRGVLAQLPDNEHEMAGNRLAFGIFGLVYLLLFERHTFLSIRLMASLYAAVGCLILVDVVVRRTRSAPRRCIAIVADMVMISLTLGAGGKEASLFYPLYLWAIFGNGFRFGTRYLLAAAVAAIGGFLVVILTSGFWRSIPETSCGLLAALALLPTYAGVLINKLSRATRAAEEASRAKSMFLAGVSHEFRTPLNAIVGSVALLDDTSLDPEQRELSASLRSGTKRLLDLINEVLDFSRLDAGRMPVEPAEFALVPLLAEITTLLRPQARTKGLRLGVHLAADVPERLFADRRHLQEILINLVGNAVKFTETGSVIIEIVRQATAAPRTGLMISVVDTGIGIKPAARKLIFESFSQADGSIIDRFGGTGLGLAICRHLVMLMGGKIEVDSVPGQGSRFWFTIDTPTCEPGLQDLPPRGSHHAHGSAAWVLLIDDPALRDQAMREIGDAGRCHVAGSIAEAIELARRPERRAMLLWQREDWITLDADARRLAQDDPTRELGCVLMSDLAPPRDPDGVFGVVDLVLPRNLPDGGLARALDVAAGLHPGGMHATTRPPKLQRSGRSLAILVADDNAINRQVLSKTLERGGHRPTLVTNGDEALEALAQSGFDLVLMDVNMPVLNGIEATRLHRLAEFGSERVLILALTADPTDSMRQRCLDAGMDQCLSKPIEPRRLLALIDTLLPATDPKPVSDRPALPEPKPGVALLADHPRFRTATQPLDPQVTDELLRLGGTAFVEELLESFLQDASGLIDRVAAAVQARDLPMIRDHLHALRSTSANVGARALHEASGRGRLLEAASLENEGPELVRLLTLERDRLARVIPRAVAHQAN